MFTSTSLQIGDFDAKIMTTIAQNILNININYTMDMSSQLSFTVIDPGLEMAANNYFQVGRDVVYETTAITPIRTGITTDDTGVPIFSRIRHRYEISSVSVQQTGSASPQWTVEALPKAVMQMKRDKKPGNIGGSGFEFVRKAANKYGLKFVGEKSARIKGGTKNSGDGQADSVWSVITGIAQSSQYVVFVADGTLYFASEKWLLFKWGSDKQVGTPKYDKDGNILMDKKGIPQKNPDIFYVPLDYPAKTEANARRFEVLQLPNLRKSENDPMAGNGSLIVSRTNGVALRPGMTIRINSVPTMNQYYLITGVTFGEQITDPVAVEFRTPERLEVNGKPEKIPQLKIGKIYRSEYFQPSPRLGETSVGLPSFNDTTPAFVSAGSTLSPIGGGIRGALPNARRPSVYPLSILQMAYFVPGGAAPSPATIVEGGNIDLWNRPVVVTNSDDLSFCATLRPHVYTKVIGGQTRYVITERIWCDSGVPTTFTTVQAETKYNTENVHHGIFTSSVSAYAYITVLIKMQKEAIKMRFPNSYQVIWNGTAPAITVCS